MELIFCLQFPLNFYKAVDSVIETWLSAIGLSVHLQQHSLHRPALDACSCSIKTLQITQDIELNLTNLNQRPYDIRVLSNFEVDVHLQILGIQIGIFFYRNIGYEASPICHISTQLRCKPIFGHHAIWCRANQDTKSNCKQLVIINGQLQ